MSKTTRNLNKGCAKTLTTFDCYCGLQIVKTCPKAVALQKRLHLSKNESCRLQYEEKKLNELASDNVYTVIAYDRSGKGTTSKTIYTTDSWDHLKKLN